MGSAGVTFVTLFLSLTTGLQPVEVAVTGPVAAVEILVDGNRAGLMEGPPWKTSCDFGTLRPLILEAVGFDEDGVERGRDRRVVNLPHPEVETSILLVRDPGGAPTSARLISQSAWGLDEVSHHVTLDGLPIEVDDPRHIPLPPCDPDSVHFLSARVDFAQGVVSHAEISFGAQWAGETSTELTAVPISLPAKMKRVTVQDLAGRFSVDGRPVAVVAVEDSPSHLVIVKDRTATDVMRAIQKRRLSSGAYTDAPVNMSPRRKEAHAYESMQSLRSADSKVRIISTYAEHLQLEGRRLELFPMSQPYALSRDAIMLLLSHDVFLPERSDVQRVSDAVAVAGVFATGTASPRAIVLVLGSDPDNFSLDSPAEVRSYLEQINVPLFVWQTSPSAGRTDWGDAAEVAGIVAASEAKKDIFRYLKRQRIVWLEGSYLPNEIELAPSPDGIEIARRAPAGSRGR